MTARILDGRAIARQITDEISAEVRAYLAAGRPQPTLAVVRLGQEPSSVRYARQIEKVFLGAGMGFRLEALPETATNDELLRVLVDLGTDQTVHGILLQLPLPPQISRDLVVDSIIPAKDVDGITALNQGHLFAGRGHYYAPATPLGGIELLRRSAIGIAGKHAVVVGRSEIVGRPLALLLLRENATVTICHSRTPELASYTRQADILAVAVGRAGLITGDMVAQGAVVVDFGVNVIDGRLLGDVDFDSVAAVAGAITPVPGGTGPMTNAMLLANTLAAARFQEASR